MKIIYLNIFEGCKEIERLEKIIQFVNTESPDVLGLSELQDWDKDNYSKLNYFISKIQLKNYFFGYSKFNRHLAIFSKKPISITKNIEKISISGAFKSPAIQVVVNGLQVTLVHLRASSEEVRLEEIDEILKNVKINKDSILMGDFNSLSENDNYNEQDLLNKSKEIGLEKFGVDKLKTSVIKNVLQFGLLDTFKVFNNNFQSSVPTKYTKDPAHFYDLRLDYIFISPGLLNTLKGSQIIKNEESEQLSDHYPVMINLE